MSVMLEIKDLHVSINQKPILKGLNLSLEAGKVYAIMGPNGSGKSTLSHVLSGKEDYVVTQGEILFQGQNILELPPEERARAGVFVSYQYPTEIPGVNNLYFLRTSVNTIRKSRGENEIDAVDFMAMVKAKMALLQMDEKFSKRGVNQGFSGGEKKRNEILQMMMLEPKLAFLDETDSGLDIDALQVVAQGINSMREENRTFVLITHYQRLLSYVKPDVIHVLSEGKIIHSGDHTLADELEKKGYAWLLGKESA
jgi:Fe-S cluster assembly ATP-binding protein